MLLCLFLYNTAISIQWKTDGTEYFDVSYGHKTGLDKDTDYQCKQAIYKQFANILLDDPMGSFRFDVSGSNGDYTQPNVEQLLMYFYNFS